MNQADSTTGLPEGARLINQRFEIKKRLGVGGMGEVYLCFDGRLSRNVALKRVAAEKDDNENRARFLREARVASQLDHANICPIYEIYEEDDNQYIVMQYVDGVTLETIRKHQKLNENQIIDIALQVCQGMQAAHEKGVVHRDIKAANIMIDRQGRVKILDFGLAKLHHSRLIKSGGETVPMTEKGMVIGTVTHMSPEQARGEELDERTDIFSFGVVLFELFEGRNPFWNRDAITTLYNICNSDPVYSDSLPEAIRQVIAACLEKNRRQRIASFSELAERLSACQMSLLHNEPHPARTEILSGNEVEVIKKAVSSSDGNQDLKDIVYRINRFKATTSPVSRMRRRGFGLTLIAALPVLGLILWLTGVLRIGHREQPVKPDLPKPTAIVVHPFQIDGAVSERGGIFAELVAYVLNQYPGLAAVMPEWFGSASPLLAELTGGDAVKPDSVDGCRALFELNGRISAQADFMNLDAQLQERGHGGQAMGVTLTGAGTASLIDHQVKSLCERVARRILGDSSNALVIHIDLPMLFGSDWEGISRFFQAQKLYRRLEYARAEEILKTVAFMPPARYLLAEIAFFNGDRARALEIVEKERPAFSQYPPQLGLLFRSLDHRLRAETDLEVALLQDLVVRYPLDKSFQYRLGEAYFHTGNAGQAIPFYLAALRLDEVFPPALNHLAYCYAYQGLHDQAFAHFEKYHQLDRSVNSFDSFGDGYFYAGDLETARAFKESALNGKPQDVAWALLTLADIHILKGDYASADEAADRYAALFPTDRKIVGESLVKKAWIQLILDRQEAGLQLLDEAMQLYRLELDRVRGDDRGQILGSLMDLGDPWREIHWLRGWVLTRLGRLDQAAQELAWLDRLVERHKLSRERFAVPLKYRHHLKAMIDLARGDETAAEQELRNTLDFGERLNYWITYYNQSFFSCELIRFLIRRQRFEQAGAEIEQAARFNPRYPPLLWLRLRLAEKTGQDTQPARRLLQEVLGSNDLHIPPLLEE